jgi:NADH:ubiquinone oxidoreductase subunit 3 (subunit A)
MNALILLFIFVPSLVGILLLLNVLFALHRPDYEKITPFECGINPIYNQTRNPFNINFYIVAVLFLIFDLEILLIFPASVVLYQVESYGFSIFLIFLIILTVGFVKELASKALNFTKI